jgi:hypothetical protein
MQVSIKSARLLKIISIPPTIDFTPLIHTRVHKQWHVTIFE